MQGMTVICITQPSTMSDSILPFIPLISSGTVTITSGNTVTNSGGQESFSVSGYQDSTIVLVAAYGRSAYDIQNTTIMTLAYKNGRNYQSRFMADFMSSSLNVISAKFATSGTVTCSVSNLEVSFWIVIG